MTNDMTAQTHTHTQTHHFKLTHLNYWRRKAPIATVDMNDSNRLYFRIKNSKDGKQWNSVMTAIEKGR